MATPAGMDIAISLTPNLMLDEREIIPFFSLRILSKRAVQQ
jgi:hypothetical protein